MILQRVAALKKTTTKKLLCTSEAEGQIHHEEFNLHMEVRGGERVERVDVRSVL